MHIFDVSAWIIRTKSRKQKQEREREKKWNVKRDLHNLCFIHFSFPRRENAIVVAIDEDTVSLHCQFATLIQLIFVFYLVNYEYHIVHRWNVIRIQVTTIHTYLVFTHSVYLRQNVYLVCYCRYCVFQSTYKDNVTKKT